MGGFFKPGNPLATSGFFGSGAAGPPPLTQWIARVTPSVNGWAGAAASTAGVTLAIDSAGQIFRSTDGGITWSASLATLVGANTGLAFSNGVWIAGATGGIYRSVNNGTSWSALIPTHTVTPGTVNMVAQGSSSSNWLAVTTAAALGGGAKNYSNSTDGGLTWVAGTTFANRGFVGPQGLIWDGAQYVAVVVGTLASTATQIATSPTGVTWTPTAISPTSEFFDNGLVFGGGLYLVPLATASFDSAVRSAVTAAGLATAADTLVDPPLATGGVSTVSYDGTLYFAFDFAGGVASSPDALTWTAEVLNFTAGDSTSLVIYDAVNAQNIAFGGGSGSISTRVP